MRKSISFRLLAALLALFLLAGAMLASCGAKKPEEQFRDLQKKEVSVVADAMVKTLDTLAKNQKDHQESGRVTGTLSVSISPAARALFLGESGLDWLSSVSLQMDLSSSGQRTGGFLALLLGQNEVLRADILTDLAARKVLLGLPGLHDQVLSIPVDALTEGSESFDPQMLLSLLPDAATASAITERYTNLLLDEVKTITEGKEELTVGGITRQVKVLRAEMTIAELTEVLRKVLSTVASDPDIEKMIRNFAALDPEFGDLYPYFAAELKETAESLTVDEEDAQRVLTYDLFVDGKKTVGRRLSLSGVEYLFHCRLEQNGNFGSEIRISDEEFVESPLLSSGQNFLKVAGSGKVSDGVSTGRYTLSFQNTDLLTVDVRYSEKAAEKGNLDFEFTLKPTAALWQMIGDEDLSAISPLLSALSFRVSAKTEKDTFSLVFALLQDSEELLGLKFDGTTSQKPGEIQEPAGAVVEAGDSFDPDEYFSGLNFEAFLNRLKAAGIPEEFLEMIFPVS